MHFEKLMCQSHVFATTRFHFSFFCFVKKLTCCIWTRLQ